MSENKPAVLYIDDEFHSLTAFRATYRRDFQIHTANSAAEGLEILKDHSVEVVISDQRMPEMTGVEFLTKVKDEYRKPIRILLTGYSDIQAVTQSINEASVFRYLQKPWDEEELRHAISQASKVYRLREVENEELNFYVYKTSHDIQGPLDSLQGLLEVVKLSKDPDTIARYINLMEKSITHVNSILTELIEFKRMEHIPTKLVEIDLQASVNEVLERLKHNDGFDRTQFNVNVEGTIPFVSDNAVVTAILQNLIQNAVKYSAFSDRSSMVAVRARIEEGQAVLDIKDNGIGIEASKLDSIFQIFKRVEDRQVDAIKGSGLGLYIVKTGIQKLGGKVHIESEVDQGTTFTVTLPNNPLPAEASVEDAGAAEG